MESFFGLVAAGPAFFLRAWLPMIFAGIVGSDAASGRSGMRPRWW